MTSREEVLYAYRLILGREPESEEALQNHISPSANLASLRELFINSPEFQQKLGEAAKPSTTRATYFGPAMDVELDAPDESLSALFDRVSAQWQYLGETEPHWSVLTHDYFYKKNFEQNAKTFFASGDAELKQFDATLARAKVDTTQFTRCVELGCGVGRVTIPLAKRYARVLGVDVSGTHLKVAEQHLAEYNVTNVLLRQLSGLDSVAQVGPIDVLYSRIVLQHNPPPVMVRMLSELLEQLTPGGVAFFQIPTYKVGYRFVLDEYMSRDNKTDMEMHFLPQAALFDLIERQGCQVLEIREDDSVGMSTQAVSNTLLVQKRAAAPAV